MMDEMREFAESVQELVQCPVCFGSLLPSHSLCSNGHALCGTCRESVDKCPLCQQQFLALRQSTLLNQLLERLPMVCPNSEHGCPVVMLDKRHQDNCEFRRTECRVPDCEWSGCVKFIQNHVKTSHDIPCFEIPPHKNSINGTYKLESKTLDYWSWSLITYDSQLFWKYFHRDGSRKEFSHKFYHVSTSPPKNTYYFSFSFKNGDFEFCTTCKAMDKVDEELNTVSKPNSITIPDSVLQKFVDLASKNPNVYRYTIKVFKEKL